jgi:hypothetical protein
MSGLARHIAIGTGRFPECRCRTDLWGTVPTEKLRLAHSQLRKTHVTMLGFRLFLNVARLILGLLACDSISANHNPKIASSWLDLKLPSYRNLSAHNFK